MQENFLRVNPGNPLEFHLQMFATWLRENGYRERVIQSKLGLVGDLRKWLGRNGRGIPHLDQQLLEAFAEHRQQVRRGDLRTLRQFLDHLRERDEEIERLLRKTQQLPSPKGLRAHTFTTLFGLLMVTGMRVSEALGLEKPDIDFDHGILHIRCGKFGKSRYVPIHPSTVEALKKYAQARDHLFPSPLTLAFFLSERGTRITNGMTEYMFAKLSQQIGLRLQAKHHGRGPRLHDMRHRFAVRTLIDWYRAGLDVERELPKLATYLGHVHLENTYWYLEAVPELMQLTINRLIQREAQP